VNNRQIVKRFAQDKLELFAKISDRIESLPSGKGRKIRKKGVKPHVGKNAEGVYLCSYVSFCSRFPDGQMRACWVIAIADDNSAHIMIREANPDLEKLSVPREATVQDNLDRASHHVRLTEWRTLLPLWEGLCLQASGGRV
jgi:hypothetical protein